MEKRFIRNMSNDGVVARGQMNIQKQLAEKRRPRGENVPDLTDFMNDMFFGAPSNDKKTYNLTGDRDGFVTAGDGFFEPGRKSVSSRSGDDVLEPGRRSVGSRSTQEWLDEAKRMVAKSPSRNESPSRVSGSPRFSISQQNVAPSLDKRDPLSRSARRYRSPQGFTGEILSKTANKHTRKNSEVPLDSATDETTEPASGVQKWFSNILKPQNFGPPNHIPKHPPILSDPISPKFSDNPTVPPLPPRQSVSRRSRFQSNTNAPQQHLIPTRPNPSPSKRTFKNPAPLPANSGAHFDTKPLSPPRHLVESAHRRSISSSTCSIPETPGVTLTRNMVDSAHRRSVSESARATEKMLPHRNENDQIPERNSSIYQDLNAYLKEQNDQIQKIMSGESNGKAKIVLSGHSHSTSSMVGAICYAWLLENRARNDKNRQGTNKEIVVPVMNMMRGKIWKQKQAAWLFHHVGLDATSLLFSDEVDLETLIMEKRLSILIVGQDILKTNSEVGSGCTIVTDNYCEDAYDLLQTPLLKKLLLAGILLDTQNLNASTKLSVSRDSAAVQLLLVGSVPNYRHILFDELMQDQRDDTFIEVLEKSYGICPSEGNYTDYEAKTKVDKSPSDTKKGKANKVSPNSGKSTTPSTKSPAATATKASDPHKGKNTFFLAKWFGFGHK